MKITKRQLKRIIKEEKAKVLREQDGAEAMDVGSQHGGSSGVDDHHWPRVDWSNIGELTDKWIKMEEDAWDKSDTSMNPDGEQSVEMKSRWNDQVENAALDMEAELTKRIRKLALDTMKEYTDLLIGGEYL